MDSKRAGRYLTFRIARRDFAMPAGCLRGLLPATDLIPADFEWSECPSLRGFVTLRGRDVPVVDLRGKLAIPRGSQGRLPCVVVVDAGGDRLVGFLADCLSNILLLRDRDFQECAVNHAALNGVSDALTRVVAHVNGRTRRILAPDVILSEEEVQRLASASLTNP